LLTCPDNLCQFFESIRAERKRLLLYTAGPAACSDISPNGFGCLVFGVLSTCRVVGTFRLPQVMRRMGHWGDFVPLVHMGHCVPLALFSLRTCTHAHVASL